jgi:hypothetical protein
MGVVWTLFPSTDYLLIQNFYLELIARRLYMTTLPRQLCYFWCNLHVPSTWLPDVGTVWELPVPFAWLQITTLSPRITRRLHMVARIPCLRTVGELPVSCTWLLDHSLQWELFENFMLVACRSLPSRNCLGIAYPVHMVAWPLYLPSGNCLGIACSLHQVAWPQYSLVGTF